ncbi:hypothetical protein HDU67_000529 [Dinochytrium kinnereticum]|nr:hypothetical protein HDU67_000529 [Dinochytrium kinnereticum]
MAGEAHSHRSTLKQANKGFKSKHASKGELRAKNKGKAAERAPIKGNLTSSQTKADRRNQAKLLQKQKRSETLANARFFMGTHAPPKIIAVIPLCPDVCTSTAVTDLLKTMELEGAMEPSNVLRLEKFRQKVQFLPATRHLHDILDMVRIADFVVFVMSADVEVDEEGTNALTAIKAQGVPSVMGFVQHLEKDTDKQQVAVRKSLLSYMEAHFPGSEAKLFSMHNHADTSSFIRHVTSARPKSVSWRDKHSYVIGEEISFEPSEEVPDYGTLKVTGFIRGSNLSANRLVHIQGFGDFQIEKIVRSGPTHLMEVGTDILDQPDPELQESLISENEPDPLDGEQTWPTEEELADAERRVAAANESHATKSKRTVRVPKGTSSYQAAWIVESEDEGSDGEGGDDSDEEMGDRMEDEEPAEESEDDVEYEEIELEGDKDDFDTDFNLADDERQYAEYLEEKKGKAAEDREFPDEVDTPRNIPARARFARYRGLKSLRTSPWDPYENLPLDYSRIFQFENFRKTRQRVFNETSTDGVEAGERVSIFVKNVPRDSHDRNDATRPFILFSLLPHEHKMTVASFTAQRIDPPSESAPIIKSKEEILIQFGFRKYIIRPVYSSDNRGSSNNVARFERFFHQGRQVVGTYYGPVVMDNEPVLMFKLTPERKIDEAVGLLATGKMQPPAPTRIVAKRILLTGHPFKINKRSAVIRFMFFNPIDVNYFRPIQLHTKLGRVGHIKESLGTHGYMKCIFDEQLKAQDTVCLSLYKRVFPKWGTQLWTDDLANGRTEEDVIMA